MKALMLTLCLTIPFASCSRGDEAANAPKADPNVIEMNLDAQKNAGVSVAPAEMTQLTEYLRVAGTVQPVDSRVGTVRSLARGRAVDVLVSVGDRVAAGQTLARVDNIEAGDAASQYLAAQAELEKGNVQLAQAARQLERSRSLVTIGVVAQKDLELADAEHRALAQSVKAQEAMVAGLQARLRRFGLAETDVPASSITTVRSPFAGVVTRVQVAPGDLVDADATIFAVADLSEVWVQAEVFEKDLGRVHVGQPARLSIDTYPGETFTGTVAHISDALDARTRTAQVRCVVANRDRRLKLDMLVSADVPTTGSSRALAVPAGAVQDLKGRPVVFVRQSPQSFAVREVQPGRSAGGLTEILKGLAEHESVVIQGAYHLKSIRLSKELGEG